MSSQIDIFNLNPQYTPEEKHIAETLRQLCDSTFRPRLIEAWEKEELPGEVPVALGRMGLLGRRWLGKNVEGENDSMTTGVIAAELERCDSALRSFFSVQSSLVMHPIARMGSEEQKSTWLEALGSGERIGAFGLTEPDFGSNPSGMRTKAVKKGNSYVLNGCKTWITNANTADVMVVWAKTEDGIQGFLVECHLPGVEAHKLNHKLSLRASNTGTVYFKDVELPVSAVLPKAKGLKAALSCLNEARFSIAWGVTGAMEDCLEEALGYAENREIFGSPLSHYQLTQQKLVDVLTGLTNAKLGAFQLAKARENNSLTPPMISFAKRYNVGEALKSARICRDILGANGISLEYRAMRHSCNLETVNTYEGTYDIHTLVLGQSMTGHAAFKR